MQQNSTFSPANAVSIETLKQRLLSMNDANEHPFILQKDGNDIIASWNIVDAKWLEVFGAGGLKKQFELRLIFDDETKTVKYKEKSSDLEWDANTKIFKFKKSVQYGKRLEFDSGASWGMKENGTFGKIYSYKFNSTEITDPVFGVINECGWNINLSVLDKKTSRKAILCIVIPLVVIAFISLGALLFSSVSGVKDAARAEVDLLRSGSITEAYRDSSSELQSRISNSDFERVIQSEKYSDIEDYSFNNISIKNEQARLEGSATYRDGSERDIAVLMIKENGKWKFSSIKLF
ncbi:hypothetical protein RHD99_09000 [Buttiauxella selenatireducens]|uniref:DUF4878 domain-containing protein n=1 Tax=Buttiauxella selenatireducens TaxID=3073902 RepID=A0ABY9SEW6_9ENTR|nr:hypothetical protein [Buttiauxella sp. R73]WMY76053.1 hypothetical protein RHD99_09000 [Buttiauxella sp. R73]